MKKFLSVFLVLLLCVSLAACSPLDMYKQYSAASTGIPRVFGKIVLDIQTDSMYPTFNSGDSIICEEVDTKTLRTGDIIAYWTIINGERTINTHRIMEIYDGGGYLIFATKGDNNNSVDSMTVHESEVIGIYVRKAFMGFL